MNGYRKFTVALAAMVISSLLMWFAKISDGVYSTIMVAAIGGYLTANVVQKKTEAVK